MKRTNSLMKQKKIEIIPIKKATYLMINGSFLSSIYFLFGVANSPHFANHCDLNLSRIGHFILDSFCNIERKLF